MLIVAKRKYKRQHVVGGSGIFQTVVNFAKKLFSSGAAKALTSSAAKQVGKHIVNKMLATSPTAETTAAAAAAPTMTQESRGDLTRLIYQGDNAATAANINNLMMRGSGVVAIQDLVKRLNGSGMKVI
jgi:hypothetical protein